MRRAAVLLGLCAAALACATGGAPSDRLVPALAAGPELPKPGPGRPQHLVVVTVHGLSPADYLREIGEPAMPTLASLAAAGAAAEWVTPTFPATGYPAHATLVTGVPASLHGVGGDQRLSPQGLAEAPLDQAADVRAETLWQAVARAGGRVAALDWPSTGNGGIADLAPDLVLPAGASWTDSLARLGAGRVAELAGRAGGQDPAAAQPGAARDAALVTMACALLVGEQPPGLVLLRLSQTAAALASATPGSATARAAFTGADGEIARLVRCLGDAGLLASTGIVVAGDHGVAAAHTELRPNAALAEAGLLVASPDGGVRSWDAIARPTGGSAFVYAQDDDAALLARRALTDLANATAAFRVLSAQEMVERGADPQAWFGLEAEPGFVFAGTASGPAMAPARRASAGGHAPSDARMATGFVAWGPAVRAGVRIPSMRQADVAPTLAAWIGASLPEARGRTLVGLFGGGGAP